MLLSLSVRRAAVCWCLALAAPALVFGQGNYTTNGVEYPIVPALPGDQVYPHLGLGPTGGILVWQDNITDGSGFGISAIRLDGNFSPALAPFRVNSIGADMQEFPQVALLNGGGAAFVWQGGRQGFQHIYARFLSSSNTWLGADVPVNTYSRGFQSSPVLAPLANGNVVVAWASYNQAATNSLRDIYAQIFSPAGQKVGGEFLVNQFTSFNQRDPAIAALADGRFVIVWVSEQQRAADAGANTAALVGSASVDV